MFNLLFILFIVFIDATDIIDNLLLGLNNIFPNFVDSLFYFTLSILLLKIIILMFRYNLSLYLLFLNKICLLMFLILF